jgi:hypothetical protein
MTTRCQVGIFGAALLASALTARTSLAQQQVSGSAASEVASEKHDSSSKADEPTEANAKTSAGMQPGLLKRFREDQQTVWTSPTKLRFPDTEWLVPLSGFTAGLVVTDSDFNRSLSHNPKTISRFSNLSNASVAALIGGAGGMWLLSHETHNEHWRETGFLAGEAALNSLVVVEGMKYSFGRQRPDEGNGSGQFLQGGVSFPSEHAAAAWSVAGVVAHEYPGTFTKIMVYGLATLVDISRLKAQKHFPSDVFVGTVIGNLVAQNIYSRHHDFNLGGAEWASIGQVFRSNGDHSPANQGSPYVPLDGWIYPALDRLIGMGMIDSGFSGVRPWTRSECARMLGEASDKINDGTPEAQRIFGLLETEFKEDLEGTSGDNPYRARLESVYTRGTEISGAPLSLADGYTFGQTLINDFGRPYARGFNSVTGFSAWTTAGRWVGYVRGEFQHSPAAPPLSDSARSTIASIDGVPEPPATPIPSINQFQLLDAYVGLNFNNWQATFGQQSLWWGPGNGGPMMFSNNAPPIEMFRINRISPLRVPALSRLVGPMRVELFFGQFAGHQFLLSPLGFVGQYGHFLDPQPFVHGQMFSFKPTRNFEFAFFRTTVYGGPGYPLTFHHLISSLFTTGNEAAGGASKPGDRRSGLSFSYRLPGLRNWLTLYGDSFTDDEFSPIAYMDVSAWHAGLYLSHFPGISRLDLRAEGAYTDIPGGTTVNTKQPGSFYQNGTWRDGYTNNGVLMGNWVGRGGQGAQVWSNYWFSPRNRLQFNFRHQKVSQEFIPGGGSLTDFGARGDYSVRPDLSLSVSVQHERWLFPSIQPNVSRNVAASIQILFEPHKLLQHSSADPGDWP